MSNDVDPHRPEDQPQSAPDAISDGAPAQRQGTTGVEPGGATAQLGSFDQVDSRPQPEEPLPQDVSAASGPPLPPVIEAFPGYRDVPKPSTPAGVTGSAPARARQKRRSQRWILLGATIAMGC